MMDTGDNKIDELFRKSLEEEEINFDEAHWRDMKNKLEQDVKRRRDIFLWTSVGGAAAIVLMTMAWWFTQSVGGEPDKVSTITPELKTELRETIQPPQQNQNIRQKQDFNSPRSYTIINPANPAKVESVQSGNSVSSAPLSETTTVNTENGSKILAENTNNAPEKSSTAPAQPNTIALPENSVAKKTDTSSRVAITKPHGFRPSVILSITAAPDLSAVNSFSNTKKGLGGGLLATITVSPVLSVTTGVQLARKVYQTGFSNYRPVTNYVFYVTPSKVDADCRVLDIPLNLNYMVWNKGNHKIELSAGSSSYFMIDENYYFEYSYKKPGIRYPSHYEVRNSNKHLMGVGNIAVSYERKLNKNSAVAIQPFVKLPLTKIGFGNVNLMSTGISANLNINLSEITGRKP